MAFNSSYPCQFVSRASWERRSVATRNIRVRFTGGTPKLMVGMVYRLCTLRCECKGSGSTPDAHPKRRYRSVAGCRLCIAATVVRFRLTGTSSMRGLRRAGKALNLVVVRSTLTRAAILMRTPRVADGPLKPVVLGSIPRSAAKYRPFRPQVKSSPSQGEEPGSLPGRATNNAGLAQRQRHRI